MRGYIIILLVLFAKASIGATFYVATTGNNSADGSSGTPWLTIQKALDTMTAGDTTIVRVGSYPLALTTASSGTAGSRITIQADVGATVTIGAITITHDYITVDGFSMTDFPSYPNPLINISGYGAQIINSKVFSNDSADYQSSVGFVLTGVSTLVSNCTIYGQAAGTPPIPSIWIPFTVKGTNHVITANVIRDMVDVERVWELDGCVNLTISKNEVRNLWLVDSGTTHVDLFQSFVSPSMVRDVLVEGNYFHDINGQIGNFRNEGNTAEPDFGPLTFRNNVIAHVRQPLFFDWSNLRLYNNTFVHSGITSAHPIMGYPNASHFDIRNNVFYACGDPELFTHGWYDLGATSTADYNYVGRENFDAPTPYAPSETHGVLGGNPAFTAHFANCVENSCNYGIGSDSVLKHAGTTIAGFSSDKTGSTRSVPWDIGAYEYTGSEPGPPPPSSGYNVNVLRIGR